MALKLVSGHYISDLRFEKSFDGSFDVGFAFEGVNKENLVMASNESGKWKIANYKFFDKGSDYTSRRIAEYLESQFQSSI